MATGATVLKKIAIISNQNKYFFTSRRSFLKPVLVSIRWLVMLSCCSTKVLTNCLNVRQSLPIYTIPWARDMCLHPSGRESDGAMFIPWMYCLTYDLRVRAFFHKTVWVCHVYCNFKIGFTCRITVIFGTLKDGSLLINTLASNVCFGYRNMFQNGVDALPKIADAFLSKSSKFHLVRIIR